MDANKVLSDIEIARQATMKPIAQVAESLQIAEHEWEPYGRHKAKISFACIDRLCSFGNRFQHRPEHALQG